MNAITTSNTEEDSIGLIQKYFSLTETQKEKFTLLGRLYKEWNQKINLISRKDIEHLYLHHILHSLSIAKPTGLTDGTQFIDAGTGGGFPGIPLAIMFPGCSFLLADSIGKKINAVNGIIKSLNLENVKAVQARVETLTETADFVTGRAVSSIGEFYTTVKKLIRQGNKNTLPNGVIYLAGGELSRDIAPFGSRASIYNISDWFEEDYFIGKKIVHIRV